MKSSDERNDGGSAHAGGRNRQEDSMKASVVSVRIRGVEEKCPF